jgi:hypothetical protein
VDRKRTYHREGQRVSCYLTGFHKVKSADLNRFLPYVGYVTIAMVRYLMPTLHGPIELTIQNDFPKLKYGLLGAVGFFLLIQKEHEHA